MWESYLAELNFQYGDFSSCMVTGRNGKLEKFVKPKSRFAPVKIPFVIPNITPHWLRHTFITNMYLAGIDILTAKEQAGHADINTTMEIYTHLDSQHKVKQIDKLNEFFKRSV
jgi:integrase